MLIKLSVRYLRDHALPVATVIVLQILTTFAALSLPTLNANIIDKGVVAGDIAYIWRTGGEMLAISAVQVLAAVTTAYLGSRTAMAVGQALRRDMFHQVQQYGSLEISQFSPPSLITRTTNDIQQIQMVLVMTFTIMVQVPIMLVGGVVMAMRQDIELSWLLVAIIPLLAGIMGFASTRLGPLFRQMQDRLDGITTVLREQLTGVSVIRAFVKQDDERTRYEKANRDLQDTGLRTGLIMAMLFPGVTLVVFAAQVGVIYFGGLRVDAGAVEIGSLVAFLNYLMQIFMSVMMAMMMFMMVPRAEVCAVRAHEVLSTQPTIRTAETPRPLPDGPLTFALSDVSFRFPGAEEDVLSHIDLALPPGTTTAIIGSTGAGKTTLVNLFPRLLDPTAGAVTANGIPLIELDLSVRERIALVPQRAFLFTGTVGSNLRLADAQATDEQLWEALRVAQATEFVQSLDDPVEAGGKNFSGGQRQRLTIARALVRRADLTVFDDSFSALDYATDATLRRELVTYLEGRSVLIVGQRVATIRAADVIVVLDDGRIVGRGTHAELMETSPTYQEIVLSQLTAEEAA